MVPYTVWGATNKVTLRIRSVLKFHDVTFDARPTHTIESSWVNYIFPDEPGKYLRWG